MRSRTARHAPMCMRIAGIEQILRLSISSILIATPCEICAWQSHNDTQVKRDDAWLFAKRLLYVDWSDERALSCKGYCHGRIWHEPGDSLRISSILTFRASRRRTGKYETKSWIACHAHLLAAIGNHPVSDAHISSSRWSGK
jgi:hypothetical protein